VIVVRFETGRLRVMGHASSVAKGNAPAGAAGAADAGNVVCAAVSALTQALYFGLSEVVRVEVTWDSWDYGDFDIHWREETLGESGRALVATVRGSLKEIAARNGGALEVHVAGE
jgi:uncharacterized protein YsxB (DUF464 family)